jgi:hypothetical protein
MGAVGTKIIEEIDPSIVWYETVTLHLEHFKINDCVRVTVICKLSCIVLEVIHQSF